MAKDDCNCEQALELIEGLKWALTFIRGTVDAEGWYSNRFRALFYQHCKAAGLNPENPSEEVS
jgi:hypothetical protein